MSEQKNLIFFVIFFIAVMGGWHYFYEAPRYEKNAAETSPVVSQESHLAPHLPTGLDQQAVSKSRSEIIGENQRVKIETPYLQGSINLIGARFDDLTLSQYRESVDPESDLITIFNPVGSPKPYYTEFGWVSSDQKFAVPTNKTQWTATQSSLSPSQSTILSWDNGSGVRFEQHVSIDKLYVISVSQHVINNSDQIIKLYPYGRLTRTGTPETSGYFVLHEGPIGFINDKLEEIKYDDLADKKEVRLKSTGGWSGFTDKYWLAAFLPEANGNYEFFFQDQPLGAQDNYLTGYYGEPVTIEPGQKISVPGRFFAGAKVLEILDDYEEQFGIKHFDLAVDFGWFYFITRPMFYVLNTMKAWLGNFGLAILLLTVLLKLLFFPLANTSYRSMAKMKLLQPKMEKIRQRYKDDKVQQNQELMNLYKKEKVNPMAGCIPILVQIPVFFALYKVLFVSIEMRQAPFYGWIHDLSVPDPTSLFNLFGLIPWDPPSFLMIGVWPILMGLSMWVQQKLNPAAIDPVQAKVFMIMPIMLTILLANFPAGLVIYWAWNNVLSITQQWVIMRSAQKS